MSYPSFGTYVSNIFSAPVFLVADLILIAIALFLIIRGAKRGFMGTALNLLRPVSTVLIAVFGCQLFGEFLYDVGILNGMQDSVFEALKGIVANPEFQAEHAGETVTGFTGIIGALIAFSGNQELVSNLAGFVTGDEAVLREIAAGIVQSASVIIAFILLLFFGSLLLKMLIAVINAIFKLPGLHFVNTTLGLLLGILSACIVTWLASYLIFFLFTWLGGTMQIPFFQAFGNGEGTYLLQMLYHFNPIQWALQTLADSMVFA